MSALLLFFSLSVAACIQPISAPPSAVASDPVAVFDALHAAINAHDVDAALAFFAEDAIVQFPNDPTLPGLFEGRSEIRKWLELDAANNIHVETSDLQVTGGTIVYIASVDVDELRPLGITLVGPAEITVQDGKISALTHVLNDETLAKLAAASATSVNDPIAVFDAFHAAINAHDLDKALSFFADDAVVHFPNSEFPNSPPPNVFTGATEIRTWLEIDAKDNIHVEVENTKLSGDTVSATASVDLDSLPPDLLLVGLVEITVKNGKITSFTHTLNDETLAKLAALESK
jgi:ketosteroid isomerase-like protein